jgi:hypothetical protein
MPVKLEKLQINEGDTLMIGHGTELSVLIEMKNGALIISGPYNKNSRTFEITTKGVTSMGGPGKVTLYPEKDE